MRVPLLVLALLCASCSSEPESEGVQAGPSSASMTATSLSVRSPLAAAMASDGTDVLVMDGLAEGGAKAYLVRPDDTVVASPVSSEPLALPIVWWDGDLYIAGGLPCPGWEGQEGTDTTFVSSYCGTTTYQLFGIDPATRAVTELGEVSGGETGVLSVVAVNDATAILRAGPANRFFRINTGDSMTATAVDLDAEIPAGVCPSGTGFVAVTAPGVAMGAGTVGTPSEGVTRHRLPAGQATWIAEPVPDSENSDQTAIVFGACDGDRVIIAAHETPTDVRYLTLSATDPTRPWGEVALPDLQPFTTIGMVDSMPLALTRIAEPPGYRFDRITDGQLDPLGHATGLREAPPVLAQTSSAVVYLFEADHSHLRFRRVET